MVCIYCGSPTSVVNSRHQKRINHIWRRRKCVACKSIVTTEECIDFSSAIIVQKTSQRLEPFSRDKLFVGIYESCRHRPTALPDAAALTQTIIGNLTSEAARGMVTRAQLVATATSVLDRFDPVAATLYKAAYRPTPKNSSA